jgi:hypothetical protein
VLAENHAYVVTGRVEEQFFTVTLTVRELRLFAFHEINTHCDTIEEGVG